VLTGGEGNTQLPPSPHPPELLLLRLRQAPLPIAATQPSSTDPAHVLLLLRAGPAGACWGAVLLGPCRCRTIPRPAAGQRRLLSLLLLTIRPLACPHVSCHGIHCWPRRCWSSRRLRLVALGAQTLKLALLLQGGVGQEAGGQRAAGGARTSSLWGKSQQGAGKKGVSSAACGMDGATGAVMIEW
jgi:hypothetical protein